MQVKALLIKKIIHMQNMIEILCDSLGNDHHTCINTDSAHTKLNMMESSDLSRIMDSLQIYYLFLREKYELRKLEGLRGKKANDKLESDYPKHMII